jgi:hypothetical protein
MTTAKIEISSDKLDAGIEMLSRASKAFRLTRFEIIAYRVLMIGVDAYLLASIIQTLLILHFIVGLYSNLTSESGPAILLNSWLRR